MNKLVITVVESAILYVLVTCKAVQYECNIDHLNEFTKLPDTV